MGDQNNISQILAALAAQQPAAANQGQAQMPQLGQQNPYPGTYNTSSPPVPTVPNFGLPPPDNTGSLNLAGIKPGDAGAVSIAEAIAKARGIAAEKGLSYEPGRGGPPRDSDPRVGARSHRRSRSPSPQRSPPRAARDNFRDNYNPYRDERRDDRRGNERSYGRDRSFSPRPTGRGAPTFPQQSRPPMDRRGMGEDNVDTITIESNLVGLIIGRQGESLRKVEADTGARIQFLNSPESNGAVRLCKITGSRASRDDAKATISRIISEGGPGHSRPGHDGGDRGFHGSKSSTLPTPGEGESTMQIMVPDRTVGLIIGRGGETIRDLQERSGCHVNIVSENKSLNGLRPVNLMGTPEASQRAQDLIKEIVESDTRHAANQPPQHHQPRGAPYGGGDFQEKVNDSMFVPPEAVGMIIGKGGETIKEMQAVTRCKINVHQPTGGRDSDREVGLFGTRDAIEQAKKSIKEKIENVEQRSRPAGRPRDDGYGDRYSQAQQQQQQQQQPYYGQQDHNQNYQQQQQQAPAQQGGADAADPYAAYGGYQNYVAMWYAAMAQQQQQQPQQGGQSSSDQPGPPGVS